MKERANTFAERHGLWDDAQQAAARDVEARMAAGGLDAVRFSFPDLHGLLRGKTIVAGEAPRAMRSGVGVPSTLLLKDTSHRTVFPVFRPEEADDDTGDGADYGGGFDLRKIAGAADVVLLADPTTFRVLPWSPTTGWLLCDVYFTDGQPVPYAARQLFRDTLAELGGAGYDYVAGIELEFHLFRLEEPRPDAGESPHPGVLPGYSLVNDGYQLLTELRYDQLDPILDVLRRDLLALGIPLISLEVELGPSQVELTARHGTGLEPADTMVLLRSAVKQICRRNGFHATFMCRPRIARVISSGGHLHQSLTGRSTGGNAFLPTTDAVLSPTGFHFMGGLLEHAAAGAAFSTPTINGYKRYLPNSLAPERAVWGRDNRGAMVRVVGSAAGGDTHLENRAGEPAANPYLYMASQILAGMDGMARKLDPGPSAETPYDAQAPLLPKTLHQALTALRADDCFAAGFGRSFVNYYIHIEQAELARFEAEVTEWEQREYFKMF